ncbi:kelch-like protein 21 [Corticium candelabrum]|uniref:kelch-like protein 21 n=1 Tax=Corticium candelabrum TaxID=121492 RepID=UPI002E26301E|nr:kelch-like protein 21 [Corticium candelabrum]
MCSRREQSLLSVASECQRSASERPTAQEIMNICFPSAVTNDIPREDINHCISLDEETLESTEPLNGSELLQIESESLEETQLSDETMRTDIVACSLQDEGSLVVQSLQDISRFSRLREISERYLLNSNGGSSLHDIGCIPEWHYRRDFPHPGETVMAVIDGKFLTGNRGRNEMYITDSASGELLQTAIFPDSSATYDGIFISDGKIFSVFVDKGTWQLSVHTYSLTDDKWTLVFRRPPNIELAAIALTLVGDRIFIAGGYNRRMEKLANVFMFSTTTREWLLLPSMPTARCSCSNFIYNGSICYAAGVENEGVRSKAVELMSLEDYEWTSLPSTMAAGGAVRTIHGTLVATGGVDDSGTVSRRVEFWGYHQKSWMPLPKLSQGRFGHGMAVDVDGDYSRIIVTGGYDKNRHMTSTVEVIEF